MITVESLLVLLTLLYDVTPVWVSPKHVSSRSHAKVSDSKRQIQ